VTGSCPNQQLAQRNDMAACGALGRSTEAAAAPTVETAGASLAALPRHVSPKGRRKGDFRQVLTDIRECAGQLWRLANKASVIRVAC
jgi:hypothetical protein